MRIKILPTITTVKKFGWRDKINEANKLGLKEVCLFLGPLEVKERRAVYDMLEKSTIKRIPFIHLRSDMDANEIQYLIRRFKTKIFNIHPELQHPLKYDISKFRKIIYLENSYVHFAAAELKKWAGLCFDVAHLETQRLCKDKAYDYFLDLLHKFPCACGHISAIKKNTHYSLARKNIVYDAHSFKSLREFDYLKRYKKYLPPLLAIELENSLKDQLRVKKYIEEKILKD